MLLEVLAPVFVVSRLVGQKCLFIFFKYTPKEYNRKLTKKTNEETSKKTRTAPQKHTVRSYTLIVCSVGSSGVRPRTSERRRGSFPGRREAVVTADLP